MLQINRKMTGRFSWKSACVFQKRTFSGRCLLLLLCIRSVQLGSGPRYLSLLRNLLIQRYDYVEKANLSRGYQNLKQKLELTTYFWEIIELKLGVRNCHIFFLFQSVFRFMVALLCFVSHIFRFWIPITLAEICIFLHSQNLCKNTSVLGGTALSCAKLWFLLLKNDFFTCRIYYL